MQTGMEANHGGPRRNPDKEEWFMKVRMVALLAVASFVLAFAFHHACLTIQDECSSNSCGERLAGDAARGHSGGAASANSRSARRLAPREGAHGACRARFRTAMCGSAEN